MRLQDLFEGRRQLVVYHFMFDPAWEKGCPGCTWYIDALGDLVDAGRHDTRFALMSRAPLAKLEAYKERRGSTFPGTRRSAATSITTSMSPTTRRFAPVEYNYRNKAENEADKVPNTSPARSTA